MVSRIEKSIVALNLDSQGQFIALTNAIAFHHMRDSKNFGMIRVWGTIGWIAVGIGIGQWLLHYHTPAQADEATRLASQASGIMDAFRLSAIIGFAPPDSKASTAARPRTSPARARRTASCTRR